MSPRTIDRYEIIAEIGRGGMATVYRARDPRFGREVAIKVLPRELLHERTFRARFEREAQVIATLEHPAIVPVHDYGEEEGQPYLVMRYMSGGSLADRIRQGPFSMSDVARVFSQLAPALDKAHGLGIIHRDLKPGNILFDQDDNAYLADFGIAKLVEGTSTLTGSGGLIGTPAYMSPEQIDGRKEVDGRSDIYALGVILFEMLTGQTPYQADTPMQIAVKHLTEPVPSVLAVRADLPPGCETVIRRAMAKNPDDRYQTARELARDLATLARGERLTGAEEEAQTLIEAPIPEGEETLVEPPVGWSAEEPPGDVQTVAAAVPAPDAGPEVIAGRPRPAPERKPPRRRRGVPFRVWVVGGVLVLAAVGLALGLLLPGGRSSKLAFASNRDGDFEIYVLDENGQTTQMTNNSTDDLQPVYLPSGQLAFASDRDGDFEIYVLNEEGQAIQMTSNPASDLYPAPLPSGRLAFASDRDGDFEIYVLDENGQLTQMTNNSAADIQPVSLPSGRLAFASNRDGDFEIYVLDEDGQLTQMTNNSTDDIQPVYLPSGRLAFASNRDGDFEIYVLNEEGQAIQMTSNPASDLYPTSSPSGRLAFASDRDGDFDIYALDETGTVTLFTSSDADDLQPAYLP